MADDLVCVRSFAMRYEAEMAQSLLENNDIRSMVSADDAGGMRPYMLVGSGGARLFVRRDDEEKASGLLDTFLSPDEESEVDAEEDEEDR